MLYPPRNYVPGVAYPLLVSLHPFITVPEAWEGYSGLAAAASERGYWVLLPHGSEPGPRWTVPGGLDTGPDDIGWIEHLIEQTAATVCVDPHRVFAAGFSAGAAMAVVSAGGNCSDAAVASRVTLWAMLTASVRDTELPSASLNSATAQEGASEPCA